MIKPPRSKHTGIGPGDMICEACANRLDRKERGWTDMGGDYTEGERWVLAALFMNTSAAIADSLFLRVKRQYP
jgi:hypothetical protein